MTGQQGVRTRLRATWRLLVRELAAFGVVGACAFVLDVGLFQLLYAGLGVAAVPGKLMATLVAMSFAYVGHRYWSFSHRARTGLRREYLVFAAVNGATLLVGLAVVWFVSHPLGQSDALVLQAANVGSITVTTAMRFTAYRRCVFPAAAKATHLPSPLATAGSPAS